MLLIVIILTFDRLPCISYPVKYKANMKVENLKKAIIASWSFTVIIDVLHGTFEEIRPAVYLAVCVLAGMYLIMDIVTYSNMLENNKIKCKV